MLEKTGGWGQCRDMKMSSGCGIRKGIEKTGDGNNVNGLDREEGQSPH